MQTLRVQEVVALVTTTRTRSLDINHTHKAEIYMCVCGGVWVGIEGARKGGVPVARTS